MKITVRPQGKQASREDLAGKIAQVKTLLRKDEGAQIELQVALAEVLQENTPISFLAGPTADELAQWVRAFFTFLQESASGLEVGLIPFGEHGHMLLLTSASDVPYLVEAVQTALRRQGMRFRTVAHPLLRVQRQEGQIVGLGPLSETAGARESFIVIELESCGGLDPDGVRQVVAKALQLAIQINQDAPALERRLKALQGLGGEESDREFLLWLQGGNFLPIGCHCLRVPLSAEGEVVAHEPALGLVDALALPDCTTACGIEELPPAARERLLRQERVAVEPVEQGSPFHLDRNLSLIAFRQEQAGQVRLEHTFVGIFTEKSADELASNVPPLKRRLALALEELRVPENSYDYRKTVEIFNTFPKVELFYLEQGELVETVRSFTLLYRAGAVKVVAIRSLALRGLTLLVIMPRSFYATETIGRIETYLCRHFMSPEAASRVIHIASDYLSLHVNLTLAAEEVEIDLERLEAGLTNLARPWDERLQRLFQRTFGEREGGLLWQRYASGFFREYRTLVHPRFALRDVRGIEKVLDTGEEVLDLWGPFRNDREYYRLQFYSLKKSNLNELMPCLENLNLQVISEFDFIIRVDGRSVHIQSFAIRTGEGAQPLASLRSNLLEALGALRSGEVENDYLNRLLVLTGLNWRELDVFRGYRNYYFQLGSPYTKKRVAFALIHNPKVALLLFRYFEARFCDHERWVDPLLREEEALWPLRQQLAEALEQVSDINEDAVLRTLFNLIDSTVRTNFFLRRDRADYFFSFKISAIGIIDMPAPRPLYEIYVHSAAMEGIHLRGGMVARGGLRWSDRPDDFRTEILGLMKTQMTKNALIVPVGSKGGFVVKTPFATRDEGMKVSREAYQTLICGLLDVTDNRKGAEIVAPQGVVAYDDKDPYLVVAADKGTAHLPDTANAVSEGYGFWLGDAFASGGSYGYDHKKLGITARGAWDCVQRHFRELGTDIQREPFTVVGIGDMSGDVFGNGMLLSQQIRLLAAFDHRHIFLDPDPDPDASYAERQRLFNLPRSSWDDYDRSLISEGGGVFSRSAKEIPLSPQVRQWLGTRHEALDAQGLIRLILSAEVDLLWNGGIGTYVKASSEKNEDVGDRANDGLRVDATALRARVVGEGGNLGLTQHARIEYALHGGFINTDAVDNSAGVDCSDHEVNLKIFMQHLAEKGVVTSAEQRNAQLEAVTDEVCRAVLANNYGQGLCLSLDSLRCADNVQPFFDLADSLAGAGLLDRRGEFLPSTKEVLARPGKSFVRPELSILMAYSKMHLYQELLSSELPGSEHWRGFLSGYFPGAIVERFGPHIGDHPLAREIAATVVTNLIVDQAGCTFVNRLSRTTGVTPQRVADVYLAFDQVLRASQVRQALYALDNRISAQRQYELLHRIEQTLAQLCEWALEHQLDVRLEAGCIELYRERLKGFEKALGGVLPAERWEACKEREEQLVGEGLDAEHAHLLATLEPLEDFLPVVRLVEQTGGDFYSVARAYDEVRGVLGLREVLDALVKVPVRDRWDRMARKTALEGLASSSFALTQLVLTEAEGNPEAYLTRVRRQVRSYQKLREELRSLTPVNFNPFVVLIRALEDLKA